MRKLVCTLIVLFLLKLWRWRGQHGALGMMQPPASTKDVGRGTRGRQEIIGRKLFLDGAK